MDLRVKNAVKCPMGVEMYRPVHICQKCANFGYLDQKEPELSLFCLFEG